jgi:iron complex outermembrane receptor protein
MRFFPCTIFPSGLSGNCFQSRAGAVFPIGQREVDRSAVKEAVLVVLLTAGANAVAEDDIVELDEITISGRAMTETLSGNTLDEAGLASERALGSDTAAMFKDVPGVSLSTGGGVSSLPVVHGMADDRVNVVVNGMSLSSACANHMNPALSYVAPAAVGKATVMAGITPVSQGGDSIGGTISVDPLPPEFASSDQRHLFSGRLGGFYRSANDNFGVNASGAIANEDWRADYNGSFSKARSYFSGDDGDEVIASNFLTTNHTFKLSSRMNRGYWAADVAGQHLPYQGFPNQRMDMVRNDSVLGGLNFENAYDWGSMDGKVYFHQTWHTMDMLPERGGSMLMKTDGTDLGYRLRSHIYLSDLHTLHIGNEFFRQTLDDWWPDDGSHERDYIELNNAERNRMGTFAELQTNWNRNWATILGIRNDTVWMDTGLVHGYSTGIVDRFWADIIPGVDYSRVGIIPFNAVNHARTDVNFDVTALASYTPDDFSRYELGFARKVRSPNVYERYSWNGGTDKSMIGWAGDGNGYQGNLDLKPETAYNFSFSANWHDADQKVWSLSVSPYYTHVVDYIWGRADSIDSGGFRGMYFVNLPHADLYGADATARYLFVPESPAGSFAVRAKAAYVRGVGEDGGRGRPCPYAPEDGQVICTAQGWPVEGLKAPDKVNLYHMMPLHGTLALENEVETGWGRFSNYLGVEMVDRKTAVSKNHGEPQTPGYVLLNLRTSYQYQKFKLDLGVDNLLDKEYFHPLGGVYIAHTVPPFSYSPSNLPAVPGIGRSVFVAVNVEF